MLITLSHTISFHLILNEIGGSPLRRDLEGGNGLGIGWPTSYISTASSRFHFLIQSLLPSGYESLVPN